MEKDKAMLTKAIVFILKAYHYAISPLFGCGNSCRFTPSCSVYAAQAFTRHGLVRGAWLTCCRLAKCHPWHAGGEDLVPENC